MGDRFGVLKVQDKTNPRSYGPPFRWSHIAGYLAILGLWLLQLLLLLLLHVFITEFYGAGSRP